MKLAGFSPTVPSMTPSTVVRYVALSWLLPGIHSFCPTPHRHPLQTNHDARCTARQSTKRDETDTVQPQTPSQLTLSELEDLEEARLDRQAAQREHAQSLKRDALQNSRLNEMFREEDLDRARRQEEINKMLSDDDEVWREERKKRMLGRFAGMGLDEVEKLVKEERQRELVGEFFVTW